MYLEFGTKKGLMRLNSENYEQIGMIIFFKDIWIR